MIQDLKFAFSPGQTAMLQNLVCLDGPRQGSPPFLGILQVRVRSR